MGQRSGGDGTKGSVKNICVMFLHDYLGVIG